MVQIVSRRSVRKLRRRRWSSKRKHCCKKTQHSYVPYVPRKTKRKHTRRLNRMTNHTRRLNRMTNHKHRTHKRIAHRCGGGVLTMCTPEEIGQLDKAVAETTPIRRTKGT